jgi:hypothetical protein
MLFGMFPGFAPLSFWLEQHLGENECGALVEWYWQGKTEFQ